MSEHERLLAEGYLDGIEERSIDDVRTMRAECVAVETGLSYFRRMVQGRLDIVESEQARRAEGIDAAGLPDLIGQLPEILAEHRRPDGIGRLPQSLTPPEPDPVLVDELDELAGPGKLSTLTELPDDELTELADELGELERRVSERRRLLFDRIDALQAELTRRYQSGEANVETLLQ